MKKVLCVDIGTSALKVSVIAENGDVLAFEREVFRPDKKDFFAFEWISTLEKVSKKIAGKICVDAICVSGNGPTIVSENGRTLLWNEKVENPVVKTRSLFIPRILAFKNKFPDDFYSSSFIFSGPEFLIYVLTGTALTILPEKRYEEFYWTKTGLSEAGFSDSEQEKFPPFVCMGFDSGTVLSEWQKRLGLEKKVPVCAGGPDFAVALIGTDTLSPGKICDRSGSSEGINICVQKPIFADGVRTLPSVVQGLWNLSVLIPESGSLLENFRDEINALSEKENSWKDVMDLCFSDKNSEGFRAMRGICDKVKDGVSFLRKIALESGQKIDDFMTVTGGQAKDERWLSKKAFDSKIDVAVCHSKDAELAGDACVAFSSMGIYGSFSEAASKIVKIENIFPKTAHNIQKYKAYRIPEKIATIIFDIDSTLYTNEAYEIEQVDVQIRSIAEKRGISAGKMRNLISVFRRDWQKSHGGKKISLGDTLTHFGVPIEESIRMREELLHPGDFLQKDEKLIRVLRELNEKYALICVTNNPVLPARKTLESLGVSGFFKDIIGLDVCKKSKPAKEPFLLAAKITGAALDECLSVGDRYDMDISLPLKMGMGGILVGGVCDVYMLPEIIRAGQ